MAKKKYYAVKVGRTPGIYDTWAECQKQTSGVSGAAFKSFESREDAENFMTPKSDVTQNYKDTHIVDIFVDGSYEDSMQRYSFGLVVDNIERTTMSKCFNDKRFLSNRNVSGELLGAMYAFSWILSNQEEGKLYRINYDYEGIEKWALGDWKTNKALTKCYSKISQYVMELVPLKFNKVPAHSGVELNEIVDQLAKEALKQPASKIELDFIDFESLYEAIEKTMV